MERKCPRPHGGRGHNQKYLVQAPTIPINGCQWVMLKVCVSQRDKVMLINSQTKCGSAPRERRCTAPDQNHGLGMCQPGPMLFRACELRRKHGSVNVMGTS